MLMPVSPLRSDAHPAVVLVPVSDAPSNDMRDAEEAHDLGSSFSSTEAVSSCERDAVRQTWGVELAASAASSYLVKWGHGLEIFRGLRGAFTPRLPSLLFLGRAADVNPLVFVDKLGRCRPATFGWASTIVIR